MNEQAELKPCPFCKGPSPEPEMRTGWVKCIHCGASSRPQWWNTRAAPKVKPLVWDESDPAAQQSVTVAGKYVVWPDGALSFHRSSDCFTSYHETVALAKAAAQADYERRILDALA